MKHAPQFPDALAMIIRSEARRITREMVSILRRLLAQPSQATSVAQVVIRPAGTPTRGPTEVIEASLTSSRSRDIRWA